MKINNASLVISAVRTSQYPTDKKVEFLLVGRSNVGKSSFINTLLNRKNLARTSAKPGKTQTLNFYLINDSFYFVDAPGYGFANVSKGLKENFGAIMENYLETRENLKMVFMLVDFRHKPTEDDVMMYNYLRHYDIPVTIVCTKCDKVSNNSVSKNRKVIMETLGLDNEGELTLFSSMKKIGKNEIYDKIDLIVDND
jgi:GTP-binding protein